MNLEGFLRARAEELRPADDGFLCDGREYAEHINPDALTDAWFEGQTSYIWKVGVLAQWDSNKCDHAYVFIGHERAPGQRQFIGMLEWTGGENDDIGRCCARYVDVLQNLNHPVFHED